MLEVKGDFCHRVRKILEDAERDDDYLEIALPERGQFPSANHYCQTALHELRHSTGHESRMKRETLIEGIKSGFGSPTKRGRNSGRRSAR